MIAACRARTSLVNGVHGTGAVTQAAPPPTRELFLARGRIPYRRSLAQIRYSRDSCQAPPLS